MVEALKEEKKPVSPTSIMKLKQVKGIGEKRATQLKALGINNVDDLYKAQRKQWRRN